MARSALRHRTTEEFFAWQERQEERYELVDGQPRLMAGTSNRHDDIVVNMLRELSNRLLGKPCRPFTGDGAVETLPGRIRRPDAGVDCGRRDPNGYPAADVRLVAEVLSPSTRDFDTYGTIAEYKALESLDYILIVEPNAAEVVVWSRDDVRHWTEQTVAGLAETIDLPSLDLTLPLTEIYDGVEFPAAVRLTLS